jgi:hypothetical protein
VRMAVLYEILAGARGPGGGGATVAGSASATAQLA